MKKFIDIALVENKEKGFTYPAAKLNKEMAGVDFNYSTVATAMVCVVEVCLDSVPEQQLKSAEDHVLELFLHAWNEKNKHVESQKNIRKHVKRIKT